MAKSTIVQLLHAYKASEILIATQRLGLFDLLGSSKVSRPALAKQLGLDENRVPLLLTMLEELSLLKGDTYEVWLTEEGRQGTNTFFIAQMELEARLRGSYNNADEIVRCLKGQRTFDPRSVSRDFLDNYMDVMYMRIDPITAMLGRWMPKTGRVAEYGRSFGTLITSHCRRQTDLKGWVFTDPSVTQWWEQGTSEEQKQRVLGLSCHSVDEQDAVLEGKGSFGLIVLYNTVHYVSPESLLQCVSLLQTLLTEHGSIVICDLFLDRLREGHFSGMGGVALDWLTHGGSYQLTLNETFKLLEGAGFSVSLKEWRALPWSFLSIAKQ